MKKFFGVLFLLLGLFMAGSGIVAIDEESLNKTIVGAGLLAGGVIFFIIGIVRLSTKTRSQRRKEAELIVLKNTKKREVFVAEVIPTNKEANPKNENTEDEHDIKIRKLEKLGEMRDKKLLTDEEFDVEKKKVLNY